MKTILSEIKKYPLTLKNFVDWYNTKNYSVSLQDFVKFDFEFQIGIITIWLEESYNLTIEAIMNNPSNYTLKLIPFDITAEVVYPHNNFIIDEKELRVYNSVEAVKEFIILNIPLISFPFK